MFSERYARLERRFQEQVESDHKDLTSGGGYVPNFTPSGSVDYVLGAMEPSTGVPGGHDGQVPEPPLNFSWSVEDFILHYCVRHYLCRSGELSPDGPGEGRHDRKRCGAPPPGEV